MHLPSCSEWILQESSARTEIVIIKAIVSSRNLMLTVICMNILCGLLAINDLMWGVFRILQYSYDTSGLQGRHDMIFFAGTVIGFFHTWKETPKWIFLWRTYECTVIPYMLIIGTPWHFNCYFTIVLNVCVGFGGKGVTNTGDANPPLVCYRRCDKHWSVMCEATVTSPVNTGEHPLAETAPTPAETNGQSQPPPEVVPSVSFPLRIERSPHRSRLLRPPRRTCVQSCPPQVILPLCRLPRLGPLETLNKSSQRLPNTPICQHQWMPC